MMNVLIWLLPKNELYAAIESVSCQIISLMLPVPFPSNCDSINNFLQTLRLPMPRHSPSRNRKTQQMYPEKPCGTQTNAATHHASHHNISLFIKKMPKRTIFLIGYNALCMLFAHLKKHSSKKKKHKHGQQI